MQHPNRLRLPLTRRRYRACLELADTAPDKAYDSASVSRVDGKPFHASLSLSGHVLDAAGPVSPGGRETDDAGRWRAQCTQNVRSELLVQAGELYLLAKSPQPALKALEEAHQLSLDDAGILADQGRAPILAKDWFKAAGALGQARALIRYRPMPGRSGQRHGARPVRSNRRKKMWKPLWRLSNT